MAAVAFESTNAVPWSSVAVSRTRRAWPSSSAVARYVVPDAKTPGDVSIALQFAPAASQRSQPYVRATVPVPVHEPAVTLRSRPSCAVPVIAGRVVLCGGTPATTPVSAESANALPCAFDAVTRTLSLCPTSAPTSVYCWLNATASHVVPVVSQRYHEYVNVIGFVPSHAPFEPVSVWPVSAVPVIVGSAWFAGATSASSSTCTVEPSVAM